MLGWLSFTFCFRSELIILNCICTVQPPAKSTDSSEEIVPDGWANQTSYIVQFISNICESLY